MADVTMTTQEVRTVSLVFAAPDALDGVSLSLMLPQGIEIAGYPGRGEVTWKTQLSAGKNVLPLKLVAVDGVGGNLVATLRHGDKEKTFIVNVAVVSSG